MIDHWIKWLYSSDYRDKVARENEMRLTHYVNTLTLRLSDKEGIGERTIEFAVMVFQNQKGKREYKVTGRKFDLEYRWPLTLWYREIEIWKHGGLIPTWLYDVVMKKLQR